MCSFSSSLTLGVVCNARIDSSMEKLFVEQLKHFKVQVHVPQKPQKKRVVITFFLLVAFKNGFVSMKGCRKRGLPIGYYYFLPKIDRVLM